MKKNDWFFFAAVAGVLFWMSQKGGFSGLGNDYMHHVRGSAMNWNRYVRGKRGCCITSTDY